MHTTHQLHSIVPAVCDLVGRIDPMQLNQPLAGSDSTVHDLLDEMIVRHTGHAFAFRGEDPPAVSAPPVYGRVPASELAAALDALVAAVESPGATELTIATRIGALDGETLARLIAFDLLVNGRDLAVATGLDFPVMALMADFDELTRAALTSRVRARHADPALASSDV